MIELLKGDCLELMKDIPDKSIDMILCDLPYGTLMGGFRGGKAKWDNNIDLEILFNEYQQEHPQHKAGHKFACSDSYHVNRNS